MSGGGRNADYCFHTVQQITPSSHSKVSWTACLVPLLSYRGREEEKRTLRLQGSKWVRLAGKTYLVRLTFCTVSWSESWLWARINKEPLVNHLGLLLGVLALNLI